MTGPKAGKVCVCESVYCMCLHVCVSNLNKWTTTDDKLSHFIIVHKYLFILNHS